MYTLKSNAYGETHNYRLLNKLYLLNKLIKKKTKIVCVHFHKLQEEPSGLLVEGLTRV